MALYTDRASKEGRPLELVELKKAKRTQAILTSNINDDRGEPILPKKKHFPAVKVTRWGFRKGRRSGRSARYLGMREARAKKGKYRLGTRTLQGAWVPKETKCATSRSRKARDVGGH